MIDAPASWPQGRLILTGPDGAGKSHIASFWAAERAAPIRPASGLAEDDADPLATAGGAVVIEDADRAAGNAAAERALFHLWNLGAQRGCLVLMTARAAPRDWGIALPDLRSRLDATAQIRLGAPDESLLAAVLVKLFADRQLAVPAGLIDWLVRRMDRDLGLARRLVAGLDAAALAQGGPVTRRMAADLLDKLTPPDP